MSFASWFTEQAGDSRKARECWPYPGCKDADGYGSVRYHGKTWGAHRLAHVLATGQTIVPGVLLRHTCNNPACCNPAHLRLGLDKDNAADRERAGHTARGERNGRAKLTAEKVREIRAKLSDGEHVAEIARVFRVSPRAISQIAEGRTWRGQ